MNSKVTGEGDEGVKKSIAIFGYKQQLLSIDMKTKVVQHVPRIIFNVFKVFKFSGFQVFKFSKFSKFSGSQRLSDFETFFYTNNKTFPTIFSQFTFPSCRVLTLI